MFLMDYELVAILAVSALVIGGWAFCAAVVADHEAKIRRAKRERNLFALRALGQDKTRTMDHHAR